MPQEFHVLRCFSCHMFQVHQVKKKPKWQCKVCSEKQSVRKVYGRGSGKECRQLVQTLNVTAAESETSGTGNCRSSWQPNAEDDLQQNQSFCLNEADHQVEESLINRAPLQSRWKQFCDEEETEAWEDEADASHDSDISPRNVTTERPTRGKKNRRRLNQYDRLESQPKRRQTQTWYATDESSDNCRQHEQRQYSEWKDDAATLNLPPASSMAQHKEAEQMAYSSRGSVKGITARYLVSGGHPGDTSNPRGQSNRGQENKQHLDSLPTLGSQRGNHDLRAWTHDPQWVPDARDTLGVNAVCSSAKETTSVLSKWSKYTTVESDLEESEEENADFPSRAGKDTTLLYSHQNVIDRDIGTGEDTCTETLRNPVDAASTSAGGREEWHGITSENHSSIIQSKVQHSSKGAVQRLENDRGHMQRNGDKNPKASEVVTEQARPSDERKSDTLAGGVLKDIQNNAKPHDCHQIAQDIGRSDGARHSSCEKNIFNLPAEELEDLPDDFDDW